MASQIVSGQWSLNESSNSVYKIVRSVLEAATSDNVQPLAILACEQFGNTLAFSQETRLRIERTVLPTPEPVAVSFLKVKIGFLNHDCANLLGSNQAGLRFLALAAILLSSLSPFHCAEALLPMLEATTMDQRHLPTIRHLEDLMSSLGGRCRRAGFADVVYGYHAIIKGVLRSKNKTPCVNEPRVLHARVLATLIDIFRQMQRVGEHGMESVEIKVGLSAAWVAAFSKWCLETPPSIYLADGTPVIIQTRAKVTLKVTIETLIERSEEEETIEITKKFRTESLHELICESSLPHSPEPAYRVTLETFRAQIQNMCGTHDLERNAILAAVPLTLRLVLQSVQQQTTLHRWKPNTSNRPGEGLCDRYLAAEKPNPFPPIKKIYETMLLVLGLPPGFLSENLVSAKSFLDLDEVENYLRAPLNSGEQSDSSESRVVWVVGDTFDIMKKLPWWIKSSRTQGNSHGQLINENVPKVVHKQRRCGCVLSPLTFLTRKFCNICHKKSSKSPAALSIKESTEITRLTDLVHALSLICLPIISLSLLQDLDDVLLVPPVPRNLLDRLDLENSLYFQIRILLVRGEQFQYENNEFASKISREVSRFLLKETPNKDDILVKSSRSDCFWYSALKSPLSPSHGNYLSITSCRGRIIHGGDVYNEIYDLPFRSQPNSPIDMFVFNGSNPHVENYILESIHDQPFSRYHFQWQMKIGQHCLVAGLSIIDKDNPVQEYRSYSCIGAIDQLASTVIANCDHPNKCIDLPHPGVSINGHFGKRLPAVTLKSAAGEDIVYPMGGDRGLQTYCFGILGSEYPREIKRTALRENACLECCVKVCEYYDCRILIL
ncbi:hypothetical protein F4808DRAFT_476149 [Astrocystis sublimbata]|nr:hypothetical protein F4808DRAFT_476149 [Astrocystis sublimbata]